MLLISLNYSESLPKGVIYFFLAIMMGHINCLPTRLFLNQSHYLNFEVQMKIAKFATKNPLKN